MFRTKIRKYYVIRNNKGQIVRWSRIGKSLAMDKRKRARTVVKSGQGWRGDTRRK